MPHCRRLLFGARSGALFPHQREVRRFDCLGYLKRMMARGWGRIVFVYVCSTPASATTGAPLRVDGGVVGTLA